MTDVPETAAGEADGAQVLVRDRDLWIASRSPAAETGRVCERSPARPRRTRQSGGRGSSARRSVASPRSPTRVTKDARRKGHALAASGRDAILSVVAAVRQAAFGSW